MNGRTADALIVHADTAMYAAKQEAELAGAVAGPGETAGAALTSRTGMFSAASPARG